MHVLVADSDVVECDAIARSLISRGIPTDVAYDGPDAYRRTARTSYDVIVLERKLRRMSGDEVCRRLAATGSPSRVLLLSVCATAAERAAGLDLGADDYLATPFDVNEFHARVVALARRRPPVARTRFEAHDIVLDSREHSVRRGSESVKLAKRHFAILEALLMADGAVVSGEALADRVWHKGAEHCATSLRTAMVGLRRALGEPNVIDTVIGIGYRIAPPAPTRHNSSAA